MMHTRVSLLMFLFVASLGRTATSYMTSSFLETTSSWYSQPVNNSSLFSIGFVTVCLGSLKSHFFFLRRNGFRFWASSKESVFKREKIRKKKEEVRVSAQASLFPCTQLYPHSVAFALFHYQLSDAFAIRFCLCFCCPHCVPQKE